MTSRQLQERSKKIRRTSVVEDAHLFVRGEVLVVVAVSNHDRQRARAALRWRPRVAHDNRKQVLALLFAVERHETRHHATSETVDAPVCDVITTKHDMRSYELYA